MGKAEENKQQKLQRLMEAGFELFTQQGIGHTSIAEIAEKACVAKGTFYLYFADKYELQDAVVAQKSGQLFQHALEQSGYQTQITVEDKVIAIVNDILNALEQDPKLLRFINRNLSWQVFRTALSKSDKDYLQDFRTILSPGHTQPEMLLYTIIELINSTCYSVILESDPVDMVQYRPVLIRSVRAILRSFRAE